MKLRLLRPLPPRQEATCSRCGLDLADRIDRPRRPCPRCGSMNRTLSRFTTETLGALDRPN